MKSDKARAMRNELVLDALLLLDVLGVAGETLADVKYKQFIKEGEVLCDDFDALAKGKNNVALAAALTRFLLAYGRNLEQHKREAPRVVVPTAGDMSFGRKPS